MPEKEHKPFDLITVEAIKEANNGKVKLKGFKVLSIDQQGRMLTEEEAVGFSKMYNGAKHHGQWYVNAGSRKVDEIINI